MKEPMLANLERITPSTKIRFKCTSCGKCCRHVKETVPVDSWDAFHMAQFLRDAGEGICCVDDFLQRYAEPALLNECGYFVYFLRSVGPDDSCIFLKDNRCCIHKAKPRACRLYPFVVEPSESGTHRYLLSTENMHHFKGPQTETKKWVNQFFPTPEREFLQADFGKARDIARLLRDVPSERQTEAVLHFHRLLYSGFDLDQPFWPQYKRNQTSLLAVLARMSK